jgi:hypothetical protein
MAHSGKLSRLDCLELAQYKEIAQLSPNVPLKKKATKPQRRDFVVREGTASDT